MTMNDERAPLELNMRGADLMQLYATQCLTEVGNLEGRVYKLYRRLPPRGRMLLHEMALMLLLWLAIHGLFLIALNDRHISYMSLICLAIGTMFRAAFRTVPFRYS